MATLPAAPPPSTTPTVAASAAFERFGLHASGLQGLQNQRVRRGAPAAHSKDVLSPGASICSSEPFEKCGEVTAVPALQGAVRVAARRTRLGAQLAGGAL